MKLIFLDVDGVLNTDTTTNLTPSGYIGVSDEYVERLLHIIEETDAKVVLTSSWKHVGEPDLPYLYEMLKEAKPMDVTKDPNDFDARRGEGILAYLESHKDIEEYVILDDYSFDFSRTGLLPHCVLTEDDYGKPTGLTDEHTKMAIDVLHGQLIPDGFYAEKFGWNVAQGYHRTDGERNG